LDARVQEESKSNMEAQNAAAALEAQLAASEVKL